MLNLFVTGTDTDVGKTLVSCAMLAAFRKHGLSTVGYKPISAGCEYTPRGLENADAKALLAESSLPVTLTQINPIAYEPPVAPHIAAEKSGVAICSQKILDGWKTLASMQPDVLLTEGAGGWQLPINHVQTLPDVLTELNPRVVLVVGMRLGCLNHSLLTAQAVVHQGFELCGWIANYIQADMPYAAENIQTLKAMFNAPLLGEVPYLGAEEQHAGRFELAVDALDVSTLLPS